MPTIIFIEAGGARHAVEAACGTTLGQAAMDNVVPGILCDCGGTCNCGTCHAYIEGEWGRRMPPPNAEETALLDGVLEPAPSSRLLCQVAVTAELDGVVVRLPAAQF